MTLTCTVLTLALRPAPDPPERRPLLRAAARRWVRKSVAFGYYVMLWWTLPFASSELL
jgi:hypothetical protein